MFGRHFVGHLMTFHFVPKKYFNSLKDVVSLHHVVKDFQRLLFNVQTYPSLQFLRLGASDLCNKEMELTGVLDNLITTKV